MESESSLLSYHKVSELRIVAEESFVDEDGEQCVAIYSYKLDALTFVDESEEQKLLSAGVVVIQQLSEVTDD